jgi:hypothetical protein
MTGERSVAPNSSTDWSRVAAPARSLGASSIAASAASLSGGPVDHVEQHARQFLAGEPAERLDAIAFALDGRLVHHAPSRSFITAPTARHRS